MGIEDVKLTCEEARCLAVKLVWDNYCATDFPGSVDEADIEAWLEGQGRSPLRLDDLRHFGAALIRASELLEAQRETFLDSGSVAAEIAKARADAP